VNEAGRIVTGAEYVGAINARASDRRYRREFQTLALRLTAPGEEVFDFGSGPGIDARFYAEHGRRVAAYDIDPHMSEYLAQHCRDFISSGAVRLQNGGYHDFLASAAPAEGGRAALVTANFAPLNLIDELSVLFAKFAALTTPTGAVLASLLSPYFVGDLRYGWWWRNTPRLLKHGHYAVPGAQALIWRRSLADCARQCVPYFHLEKIFAGTSSRSCNRAVLLHLTTCRFMFLLFRKPPDARSSGAMADAQRRAASIS
jgi:SAM-dependent methyltransferase